MNIYRYTIVETSEVFEGTRRQACEHFKCGLSKLDKMRNDKRLLREVVDKTPNTHEKRQVNVYRFEYQDDVFEGTNNEAQAHYNLQEHSFNKGMRDGEIKREFLKKGYRKVECDRQSSPKEKRVYKRFYLEEAWRKGV